MITISQQRAEDRVKLLNEQSGGRGQDYRKSTGSMGIRRRGHDYNKSTGLRG